MWKFLSEFLHGKTKSLSKGLIKDGVIETNKTKIANMFNESFTNIGVELANKIPHYAISDNQFPVKNDVPKLHFSEVKPVFLQSLPVNKTVRLDHIYLEDYLLATVIDNSIAFMLNLSLKTD